jgi:hypothetical protein
MTKRPLTLLAKDLKFRDGAVLLPKMSEGDHPEWVDCPGFKLTDYQTLIM